MNGSMPIVRQGCSKIPPPMMLEPTMATSEVARSSSARRRIRAMTSGGSGSGQR